MYQDIMEPETEKPLHNSEGENLMPKKVNESKYDDPDNLGLDADRSSDNQTLSRRYNIDNDVISQNPDGEDDSHDSSRHNGSSPLMDK